MCLSILSQICGREEAAAPRNADWKSWGVKEKEDSSSHSSESTSEDGDVFTKPATISGDWDGRVKGTPVQDEGFICAGGPAPLCPTGPMAVAAKANADSRDWDGRVKGTPIQDEGFICAGGPAPICPTGPSATAKNKAVVDSDYGHFMDSSCLEDGPMAPICPVHLSTGPITLVTLQGAWVGSSGSSINVIGTDVFINGMPLTNQKVEMDDDGVVLSIGRLWQLDKWTENGGIQFRCSSTREGMESARADVWSRAESSADWTEKMKELGYAGSSADPLSRGIEGCMPGTMGIEEGAYASSKDKRDTGLLAALISQWREPVTEKVRSRDVLPDFVNRAQTGIGVELMHYVATCMADRGFQKRVGGQGHDIPVVVREPPGSQFREEAFKLWSQRVADEEGFPPIRVDSSREFFTSLGNGHFFQALNLFACECRGINVDRTYIIGNDSLLAEAVEEGVPSIVLKHETPRAVRSKIAELLNIKREFHWTLSEDGQVDVNVDPEEDKSYCSQFEWLSKGMDAEQVNCLVRVHLGITDSKRIMG